MGERRWTAEQAAAVTATEDVLLTANAGTGKTTTVVGKILWALGMEVDEGPEGPLPPVEKPLDIAQIVAITFTEKAAHDLERKLRSALESSATGPSLRWRLDEAYVGTIHGFCAMLLREHALRLGIDPTFRVLDAREARAKQEDLIRDVVMEALADEDAGADVLARRFRLYKSGFAGGIVDLVRSMMRDLRWHAASYAQWTTDENLDGDKLKAVCAQWTDGPDDDTFETTNALYRLARTFLERWKAFELEENVRDFDALVLDARALLCESSGEAALSEIRRRCRLLIIDELQDTDFAQRDLAFAIAGQGDGPQLFFVGDPKQSIYRFRGADVSVWNDVEKALQGRGRQLPLSVSFRSTTPVVDLVNEVGERTMNAAANELREERLSSAVGYSELAASRTDVSVAAAHYIHVAGTNVATRRPEEGRRVGEYIRDLVDNAAVRDVDSGVERPCTYADIAVLYRASTDIELVAQALRKTGVPFRMAGMPHLERRLEVLDLVNLLRLLRDPGDDMCAFGFLRSPFVSLRDEVIARMRLRSPRRTLLEQARMLFEGDEWSPAEFDQVPELEREALGRALQVIQEARALVGRRPLDEIVDRVLDRTGYREQLVLRQGYEEALTNIQAFLRMLEGYRELELGQLLEMWDRWGGEDTGIPQAAMHSTDDNVVTLSTIHAAKGLEWPVVIVIKGEASCWHEPTNGLVTDPMLGPLIVPKKDDRGDRAVQIIRRERLEETAEAARLLYVALTRARDRVIVTGFEKAREDSFWAWTQPAVGQGALTAVMPEPRTATDAAGPTLDWLSRVTEEEAPPLVAPMLSPAPRWLTSATELMLKDKDPEAWERRYEHGALAPWEFTRDGGANKVPANVRGTVIHGVLERIQEERELAQLLDETIGGLDDADIESVLGAGSAYREALEAEIANVVRSPEWAAYTEGEHYRELSFTHLADRRAWRAGAFDLYRPGDPEALIVDFKTHPVKTEEEAEKVAEGYGVQVRVYREAAALRGAAEVRLHFTNLDGRDGQSRRGTASDAMPDRATGAAISAAIQSVRTGPNRLVLVVGPQGSGKTRHLMAVSRKQGYPRLALNATLGERLRSVPKRRRPTHVRACLSDLIVESGGDVVLIDNMELLFLPELDQDPLQLLKDLARNRTLCVAWPGRLDTDGSLIYAELGHAEYRRYRDHRTQCITMPGTL